jgi:hypothetical protein
MNEHEHLIYVVATRPYAEKVIENRFFFDENDAKAKQYELNKWYNLRGRMDVKPFKVFEARLVIMEKEINE